MAVFVGLPKRKRSSGPAIAAMLSGMGRGVAKYYSEKERLKKEEEKRAWTEEEHSQQRKEWGRKDVLWGREDQEWLRDQDYITKKRKWEDSDRAFQELEQRWKIEDRPEAKKALQLDLETAKAKLDAARIELEQKVAELEQYKKTGLSGKSSQSERDIAKWRNVLMSNESPDVALPYGMAERVKKRIESVIWNKEYKNLKVDDPRVLDLIMSEISDRKSTVPGVDSAGDRQERDVTVYTGIPRSVLDDPSMQDLVSRYFTQKWRYFFFPSVPSTEPADLTPAPSQGRAQGAEDNLKDELYTGLE